MLIDFRSKNSDTNLQRIFVEVITQQTLFHCFYFPVKKQKPKLHWCSYRLKRVYKKLGNCGLQFKSFKPANTLRWIHWKGEKQQKSYKNGTSKLREVG